MALCVFDLDNTLGDFYLIDYFGLLLEPTIIPNHFGYIDDKRKIFLTTINNYSKKEKELLLNLRNQFEKTIEKEEINIKILRPNLKKILEPLVFQYEKHKIKGFIIYSNNANLYVLEYAGRAIENMFHTPDLFIKYLDRNHEERNKFDSLDNSGYRSKMVKTITQYIDTKKPILFVDDLKHNDFYKNENVTYIMIPPFISNSDKIDLQIIILLFEDIFNRLSQEEKILFFNLYHIKDILQIYNVEDIKRKYLEYSREKRIPRVFKEDLPMIEEKINSFIKKVSTSGGKCKQKNTRKHKRYTKKRKMY